MINSNAYVSTNVIEFLINNNFDVSKLEEIKNSLFLRFDTKDFNLEIDWNIAKCLTNYQQIVYETYCFAKYGKKDVRKLTIDEKNQLCLKFKIKPGSTDYWADLKEVLVKMLDSLPEKHRIWAVALVCLTFWGTIYTPLYFSNKKDERQQSSLISSLENDRIAINKLSEIAKENVIAKKAIKEVVMLQKKSIENMERASTNVIINQEEYTKEEIGNVVNQLSIRTKKNLLPTSENIKAIYKVNYIGTTSPYKLSLENDKNEKIYAAYDPDFLENSVLEELKKAVTSSVPLTFEFVLNVLTDKNGNKSYTVLGANKVMNP